MKGFEPEHVDEKANSFQNDGKNYQLHKIVSESKHSKALAKNDSNASFQMTANPKSPFHTINDLVMREDTKDDIRDGKNQN